MRQKEHPTYKEISITIMTHLKLFIFLKQTETFRFTHNLSNTFEVKTTCQIPKKDRQRNLVHLMTHLGPGLTDRNETQPITQAES